MLNLKNKTVSLTIVFFLAAFNMNAGNVSGIGENKKTNDTTAAVVPLDNSAFPEIPLHSSMGNFVSDYAESNEELFEKLKTTKSNYFKTIDKVFTQQNIPLELKYLGIIESEFKTSARSGVGAVGVWQFMPGTAKTLGLKITSKYDERQNLWKSTVAAAKYLKYLHSFFDDWLLVVASYNSGPAPVLNAIKKSGSKSFWKLQYFLPKETRLHVKRFIATHYYFEGKGSMVTLGKSETEKYLKDLEEFNTKNIPGEEQKDDDQQTSDTLMSHLVAVMNNENELKLVLRR
jgi:membrane-bound lytic murein transglycosylase D